MGTGSWMNANSDNTSFKQLPNYESSTQEIES